MPKLTGAGASVDVREQTTPESWLRASPPTWTKVCLTTHVSPETSSSGAEPTASESVPAAETETDPQVAFQANGVGVPYTGTVTGVELLGGTDRGIPIHRIGTNLTDAAKAVEVFAAYQSAMNTGRALLNVLDASEACPATTSGDPETCAAEGT